MVLTLPVAVTVAVRLVSDGIHHHTVLGRLPEGAGDSLGWFAHDKVLNVKVLGCCAPVLAAEVTQATSGSNCELTPLSTTLRVPRVTRRYWTPRKATSAQHCVDLRPNRQSELST
jgi:hypothetical protein